MQSELLANGTTHSGLVFPSQLTNQGNPPQAHPEAHLPNKTGFCRVDN